MKSVSNGKFFSTSPSLCWRCSGRNTGWTNKARTLPLRKPTPLAPKVFDPPMLENKHGKRKGLVNDKDLPLHFLWCLFVFMFIVSLVFLVLFFLVFGGSVFVFNDEIHLGKGSSHNFRGNLQVVFSKSPRTCPWPFSGRYLRKCSLCFTRRVEWVNMVLFWCIFLWSLVK